MNAKPHVGGQRDLSRIPSENSTEDHLFELEEHMISKVSCETGQIFLQLHMSTRVGLLGDVFYVPGHHSEPVPATRGLAPKYPRFGCPACSLKLKASLSCVL